MYLIFSSALILTLVNIVFFWLRTVSHGFKRIRIDLSHNRSSFDTILYKILLPWTNANLVPRVLSLLRERVPWERGWTNAWAQWRHNMAAGIPFMEVTGRKDVQNGGRSILKMTTGFGLFSSLSKGKICFFLLFTTNLSYFNTFKLPYKIRLLAFRSPLTR